MDSIKYACSLNNQGVGLLVSGESSRAMKVFQSAVVLLKKAVHEAESNSSSEMQKSSDEDASLPFCESTSTVSGLQDLHCYVYDHGVMIPDNANEKIEEMLSLYIAVVLFNLGLASHCEGTALGRDKLLKKASVLYGLTVQLLTSCTMAEDASTTTVLTLLALYNLAHIHYDQCEYVHSVNCMKNISKIMGGCRGLHSALNHEDVEGLKLNVMLLTTPSGAQAA
jgi:hypothetical protein